MSSVNFWIASNSKFDVMDEEELTSISGGEVVVTANDAAGIGDRAGQFWNGVASSWNSFWSGFNSGYQQQRK